MAEPDPRSAEPAGSSAEPTAAVPSARPGGLRELPETADTEALGRELATQLRAGDLVLLDGPLGAGKTALTRGIAAGLGVSGRVSSPTFIIARQHAPGRPGAPGLIHVDAYRLGGLDDLDALDLDTDLTDSVVVVEWGEGIAERLADEYLLVRLSRFDDSETRRAHWEWVRSENG